MFEIVVFLLGGVSHYAFTKIKGVLKAKPKEEASVFKTIGYFTTELQYSPTSNANQRRKAQGYTILYQDDKDNRKVEFRFSAHMLTSKSGENLIKSSGDYITLVQPWLEKSISTEQLIKMARGDFISATLTYEGSK